MNEILHKRIADMTTFEMMESVYLIEKARSITMSIDDFAKTMGVDNRKVYKLLKGKILPEEIIRGGYDSLRQRKSPVFITEEVLKWIKN
ncbi:hypothetical protein [Riemerella anatipestifer]|uniref:hypothetical protein n=1 Tax=Riemerella anatipestifer TaxID=34085 RepID=UPI001C99C578|nr:hypothetical protein [Riemerella anatipestifer]QZO83943.1 hypothetical protein K6T40_03785 [Riemerella anatipestifer]